MERRRFLALGAGAVGGVCLRTPSFVLGEAAETEEKEEMSKSGKKRPFEISLAQWSWHRRLFSQQEPKMDNLDFAEEAGKLGIKAIEYVNQFFMDKAEDDQYLRR